MTREEVLKEATSFDTEKQPKVYMEAVNSLMYKLSKSTTGVYRLAISLLKLCVHAKEWGYTVALTKDGEIVKEIDVGDIRE